jgi:hypothetical protein
MILGFRSVLKLTPSHPRNPKYKLVTLKWKVEFVQNILFHKIKSKNPDKEIKYVHKMKKILSGI